MSGVREQASGSIDFFYIWIFISSQRNFCLNQLRLRKGMTSTVDTWRRGTAGSVSVTDIDNSLLTPSISRESAVTDMRLWWPDKLFLNGPTVQDRLYQSLVAVYFPFPLCYSGQATHTSGSICREQWSRFWRSCGISWWRKSHFIKWNRERIIIQSCRRRCNYQNMSSVCCLHRETFWEALFCTFILYQSVCFV